MASRHEGGSVASISVINCAGMVVKEKSTGRSLTVLHLRQRPCSSSMDVIFMAVSSVTQVSCKTRCCIRIGITQSLRSELRCIHTPFFTTGSRGKTSLSVTSQRRVCCLTMSTCPSHYQSRKRLRMRWSTLSVKIPTGWCGYLSLC